MPCRDTVSTIQFGTRASLLPTWGTGFIDACLCRDPGDERNEQLYKGNTVINGYLFASLSKKPRMGFNVSPLLCPAPCHCFVCVCMLSPQFLLWGHCLSPWGVGATLSLLSVARGLGWVHIAALQPSPCCCPLSARLPAAPCPAHALEQSVVPVAVRGACARAAAQAPRLWGIRPVEGLVPRKTVLL